MAPRARNRSSDAARAGAGAVPARRSAQPVLRLQAKIGNRAASQVLARQPATTVLGTAQVDKLPAIKIVGGNVGDWAAKKDADYLEITSKKGKHSAKLEKLSKDKAKVPTMKVTTPMVDQDGKQLAYGSVVIEFGNARISGYSLDGDAETWRIVDWESAHRTTTTHHSGI
jgi:hypothetical protein